MWTYHVYAVGTLELRCVFQARSFKGTFDTVRMILGDDWSHHYMLVRQ